MLGLVEGHELVNLIALVSYLSVNTVVSPLHVRSLSCDDVSLLLSFLIELGSVVLLNSY